MILIIIGIDVDGVVNDLTLFHISCGTKFCFENNILHNIISSQMDSSDIFHWSSDTDERFWNEYYMQLLSHSTFVRPFVSEVTKQLLNEGHKIIFITARSDKDLPDNELESMFHITARYLNENHIYYTELLLSENKKETIELNTIDIMIEDNPIFFKKNKSFNIPLLCFDTPYNTEIFEENIIRVYSWYDILQKIHLLERGKNEYK